MFSFCTVSYTAWSFIIHDRIIFQVQVFSQEPQVAGLSPDELAISRYFVVLIKFFVIVHLRFRIAG